MDSNNSNKIKADVMGPESKLIFDFAVTSLRNSCNRMVAFYENQAEFAKSQATVAATKHDWVNHIWATISNLVKLSWESKETQEAEGETDVEPQIDHSTFHRCFMPGKEGKTKLCINCRRIGFPWLCPAGIFQWICCIDQSVPSPRVAHSR